MEQLIISLVAGALGGNIAGGVLKNLSMGPLMNSIIGIIGGGLGGKIIAMMGAAPDATAAAASGLDIAAILTQVAAGGVGGGVLLAIVGMIKGMMAKSS